MHLVDIKFNNNKKLKREYVKTVKINAHRKIQKQYTAAVVLNKKYILISLTIKQSLINESVFTNKHNINVVLASESI